MRSYISGVGGYVPPEILDNAQLEKMVDTSNDWITTRTGIKERRILDKSLPTSYMAIKSIENLQKIKPFDPLDIDLIICPTITPDYPTPSTANIVAAAIGAKNAFSFDINVACSGFLYGLSIADSFITSGKCKKVLLVGVDKMSSITDYKDRSTCILFGDGAGAVLMEPSSDESGIYDSILKADGSFKDLLYIKSGGSACPTTMETLKNKEQYIKQEGRSVYKYAVSGMVDVIKEIIQKNNIDINKIKYIVPHQANKRIIDAILQKLDVPPSKCIINIDKYGNTTGATLPLCLWDYRDELKKGDEIIFVAFGAGFTWGACYMKW